MAISRLQKTPTLKRHVSAIRGILRLAAERQLIAAVPPKRPEPPKPGLRGRCSTPAGMDLPPVPSSRGVHHCRACCAWLSWIPRHRGRAHCCGAERAAIHSIWRGVRWAVRIPDLFWQRLPPRRFLL